MFDKATARSGGEPVAEWEWLFEEDEAGVPSAYGLMQNYPNPFNPTTTIAYTLPASSRVRLSVYDVLGREVHRLVDGFELEGAKTVAWDARDAVGRALPSGTYFSRMVAGDFTFTRQMLLLR